MTYTYDDIVTAKDILTGKVKKEDIIGVSGWFLDIIPSDMRVNTLVKIGHFGILKDIDLDYAGAYAGTFRECAAGMTWAYFMPEKKKSAPEFKVGDRVRIVKDWAGYKGYPESTVGKTGIIRIIGNTSYGVYIPEDDDWWGYSPDALELIEEAEEEKKSYEERQEEWVKANNIKAGDKVRVLRKAESHEDGWTNTWASDMDEAIGNIRVVREFYATGIELDDPASYRYPYFVLEKVEDQPRYTMDDVISDPRDPRLEGAIGKRVFCHDFKGVVLNYALTNRFGGLLAGFNNSPDFPFYVDFDVDSKEWGEWKYIIIAKDQPSSDKEAEDKPEYVPFDLSKEEDRNFLRGKWVRKKNTDKLWEDQILSFGSDPWLKDPYASMNMAAERADALLAYYEFLDGTPCGKQMASK